MADILQKYLKIMEEARDKPAWPIIYHFDFVPETGELQPFRSRCGLCNSSLIRGIYIRTLAEMDTSLAKDGSMIGRYYSAICVPCAESALAHDNKYRLFKLYNKKLKQVIDAAGILTTV